MLLLLAALALAEPLVSEVLLDDGQVLRGQVEKQADGSVVLTLASGTMLRFPAAAVRDVRTATAATPCPTTTPVAVAPLPTTSPGSAPLPSPEPGGAAPAKIEPTTASGWPRDPNRNRYLYSPSAFTLGRGRGYISQKELVLTEAAFGITDFWDIQAGTSVITLLIDGGQFGVVGTKLAFPIGDMVHLGAGGQALFLAGGALGMGFATVTVGTEDRHLSVNVGALGVFDDFSQPTPVMTVSGNWRLGAKTALVSENWIFFGGDVSPTGDPVFVVPSLAIRLIGPAFATDLGVVPIILPGSNPPVLPIPWVGFTWNFALPYAK